MSSFEFALVKAFGSLVLPPGANFVVALLALALLPFARRLAVVVLSVSAGSLYVFSTGIGSAALARSLPAYTVLSQEADLSTAGAIVVLSGGGHMLDPEGVQIASASNFSRLRYAAFLHRRTGLPLLVSGGGAIPEAELMVRSLENDFGLGARFVERRSRNTAENAAYSAELLAEAGITRIVLVTNGIHMPRAVEAFQRQGLEVTPAPLSSATARHPLPLHLTAFLPHAGRLTFSARCLHEHVGRLWYRMRYRGAGRRPR